MKFAIHNCIMSVLIANEVKTVNSEGFELFERKEDKLKEEKNKTKDKVTKIARTDSKPLTKQEKEEKKLKIQKQTEIIKVVLLVLILFVSAVTMFFSIKTYYIYASGGEQKIVFLKDVIGSNNSGSGEVIVQTPEDVVTTTQPTTQQMHITVVTQPNGANNSQGQVQVQNGNTVNNNGNGNSAQSQSVTETTAAQTENNVSSGLININTASLSQLMSLPGIGEVKAQSIINYRNENGHFNTVDELVLVSGIGEKTVEKIRPYVTV